MSENGSRWVVSAWTLSILSGAAATAVLRAPIGGPAVPSAALAAHTIVGVAIALAVAWPLARRHARRQLAAALVAAAVASGFLASRAFTPFTVAGHAIAAFAPLALLVEAARAARWKTLAVRVGSALLLLQIALAALVRHHVIGVTWHLLLGGIAAAAVLVPAVAVTQDEAALTAEKRAARWAIAGIVTEALLGAALLMLAAGGTDNVPVWAAAMNAHVFVATLTLLAAANLSRILAGPGDLMARRSRRSIDPL